MSPGNKVYQFKTKNKVGFTSAEVKKLLKQFPGISMKKFNDNMLCHTCPIIDGEFVFYTHDIACAVENALK